MIAGRPAAALALSLAIALFAARPAAADQADKADTADKTDGADTADNAAAPPATKKHQLLAAKAAATADPEAAAAWRAELAKRIGKPPPPVINIFNTWTHETVAIETSTGRGAADLRRQLAEAARQVNDLANKHLRCHFTNEPTEMDARLFTVLVGAARHFGAERVEIISGFRAEKYNLILRKKGREVARNSHHTLGHAVDFRLPGVPTRRLRDWARRLRLGGVGYYPASGFVHVDVGKIRTWQGK